MATANPTPTASATPAPVTDFVIAKRQPIGGVLVALGVIALIAGIWLLVKGLEKIEVPAPPSITEKTGEAPEVTKVTKPGSGRYLIGGAACLVGGFVAGLFGGAFLAVLPRPRLDDERRQARLGILLLGGLLGLVMIITGIFYFVYWSAAVTEAIADGKLGELVKVVAPLLGVLVGAGIAFLACLPARAEERNNVLVRRSIYGTNVVLSGILLLTLLVIGNIFLAVRVPNKLDTTATGFYSLELNEKTKEYLAKLNQKVRIYSTIPDEGTPMIQDVRRLLDAMATANPEKVQVRNLSATVNADEIKRLRGKYPNANLDEFGILITVGEDEQQYGFIRLQELFERSRESTAFKGESRVIQELLTIAEGDVKTVVYFTQGNGELSVMPGARGSRTAGEIRGELEDRKIVVKTLTAEDFAKSGDKPRIPDDATIVVVADPQTALPASTAAAINDFVSGKRPSGKPGRLIVLTSPRTKTGGGVESTGLEAVYGTLGVDLHQKFLYSIEIQRGIYNRATVKFADQAIQSGNLIASTYPQVGFRITGVRVVAPNPGAGGQFRVSPLMETAGDTLTFEDETEYSDPITPYRKLFQPLEGVPDRDREQQFAAIMAKRGISDKPRSIAVTVSEGDSSRAVLVGTGDLFSDEAGRQLGSIQAKIFVSFVDFLRDRPAVSAVTNKAYGVYVPNPKPDMIRLLWLPGGLAILLILALGAGVWTLRRT